MGNKKAWPNGPSVSATRVTSIGSILRVVGCTVYLLSQALAYGAIFPVTNTLGSGAGSLTQAILNANSAAGSDTIQISAVGTIPGGLPDITGSVTILGPGANLLSIDGGTKSLRFSASTTSTLIGVTFSGGRAGAIVNAGELTITDCDFSNNLVVHSKTVDG